MYVQCKLVYPEMSSMVKQLFYSISTSAKCTFVCHNSPLLVMCTLINVDIMEMSSNVKNNPEILLHMHSTLLEYLTLPLLLAHSSTQIYRFFPFRISGRGYKLVPPVCVSVIQAWTVESPRHLVVNLLLINWVQGTKLNVNILGWSKFI